jgi:O-acetylserine/cysteine efflux transporter
MKPIDILLATSVPLIWGTGFVLAKVALHDFPPVLLMALRFTLTALVLVWFFMPPVRLMPKLFAIALISGSIQYGLTFNGLKHLDASTAGLVVQTEVPFAALLAVVFLRERLTVRMVAGLVVAFVGLLIVAGEPKIRGQELALLMVLGGAFTWSIGQVMVRSMGEIGGFVMITGVALFAAPQLFVASWLFEDNQVEAIRNAGAAVWIAVVYMGLAMTAIAYAIWYGLLGRYPVNNVAPFLLLLPVVIAIEGVVFLGEAMTWQTLAGGALILAGVAVITLTHGPGPARPAPSRDSDRDRSS